LCKSGNYSKAVSYVEPNAVDSTCAHVKDGTSKKRPAMAIISESSPQRLTATARFSHGKFITAAPLKRRVRIGSSDL